MAKITKTSTDTNFRKIEYVIINSDFLDDRGFDLEFRSKLCHFSILDMKTKCYIDQNLYNWLEENKIQYQISTERKEIYFNNTNDRTLYELTWL